MKSLFPDYDLCIGSCGGIFFSFTRRHYLLKLFVVIHDKYVSDIPCKCKKHERPIVDVKELQRLGSPCKIEKNSCINHFVIEIILNCYLNLQDFKERPLSCKGWVVLARLKKHCINNFVIVIILSNYLNLQDFKESPKLYKVNCMNWLSPLENSTILLDPDQETQHSAIKFLTWDEIFISWIKPVVSLTVFDSPFKTPLAIVWDEDGC